MEVLAIYDEDWEYARRLADYIGRQKKYRVFSFENLEKLLEYGREHYIDVFLTGLCMKEEDLISLQVGKIILLSEGERFRELSECEEQGYYAVYKYQAADQILREIRSLTVKEEDYDESDKCRISAVYSPVKRCGKTTFAIALAKKYSRTQKALYLNLEMFSGILQMFDEAEYDIGDLMFSYRQGRQYFRQKILNMVTHGKEMDYILPARYGSDLCEYDAKDWMQMVRELASTGIYEQIVLDLGELGFRNSEILESCQEIFVPRLRDIVSEHKIREWEQCLLSSGREEILGRCIYLDVPISGCIGESAFSMDAITWEKTGRYLMEENGGSLHGRECTA